MQVKSQNNMAQVAKTQTKKKKKSVISRENRKKVAVAYYQMYGAMLLKNIVSGMTLGAALHNAMQLIRAKLSTMDKSNPITRYLLRINARHSKRIAKFVMTSKHRDSRAKLTDDQRAKLSAAAIKLFTSANFVLNTVSAQYKPKQMPTAKKQTFASAQKKIATIQKTTVKQTQQQNIALIIKMKQMNNIRQYAS